MGCKGSKNCDIIVQYEGVIKQFTGKLPTFLDLNEWIFNQFPDLRCHAFSLKVNSIQLKSQAEYAFISKSSDFIKIIIEKIISSVNTNLGIVKIQNNKGKMLSTGFLINKNYVMMPKACFNDHMIEDLKIILPNYQQRCFKNCIEKLEIGLYFIAARIDEAVIDFEPISLQAGPINENENYAALYFYTEKLPILQKYSGNFTRLNESQIKSELVLDMGAAGSPILTQENKLFGVYVNNTLAVSALFITKNLETIIKGSSLNFYNSHSTTPDILIDSFPNTTCYLDHIENRLFYYSIDETIHKAV